MRNKTDPVFYIYWHETVGSRCDMWPKDDEVVKNAKKNKSYRSASQ